ncbi:MAG: hypothetical protein WC683_06405 [bacterium]
MASEVNMARHSPGLERIGVPACLSDAVQAVWGDQAAVRRAAERAVGRKCLEMAPTETGWLLRFGPRTLYETMPERLVAGARGGGFRGASVRQARRNLVDLEARRMIVVGEDWWLWRQW